MGICSARSGDNTFGGFLRRVPGLELRVVSRGLRNFPLRQARNVERSVDMGSKTRGDALRFSGVVGLEMIFVGRIRVDQRRIAVQRIGMVRSK